MTRPRTQAVMFHFHLNAFFSATWRSLVAAFFRGTVALCLCVTSVAQAGVYEDFFNYLQRNDVPAVKRLLQKGFDPNSTGPNGMVALHMAIMERAYNVAETLIQATGIQLDKRNLNDETPLMLAALRGHVDLSRLLLSKGADVNKPGWTALHYAASGEQTEIVRMLLDRFAYVDAEAPSGNTPLMMAVMYGPEANITLLLDSGADPTLRNNAGRTAMDLAEGIKRAGAVQLLRPAIVRWLDNETIEAARMKRVEEQIALEEAAEMVQEAQDGAASALRNLRAAYQLGQELQTQADAAAKNVMQVVDLAPLPPLAPPVQAAPAIGPARTLQPGTLAK